MKLTTEQLRLMCTIADAEIDGKAFVSGSPWQPVFHTLLRRGILRAKPTGKMRTHANTAREHVYELTEMGTMLLAVVDLEIESVGQVVDLRV